MASVWVAPPSGDLLNNGQSWRHGDQVALLLNVATNDLDYIELIGGQLPPGLFYNGGTRKVQGTIGALPKDITSYPVVFRVHLKTSARFYDRSFRWIVDVSDEEQHWTFPGGLQDLGQVNRGSSVTIQLDIVNPDQDKLVFKAVGFVGPQGSYEGLPNGLEIDPFARIIGSPTITGNHAGDYYFRVYARDPDDVARNPHGEGAPRTSEKVYKLTIGQEIVLDARLSDVVRWETAAGSLGSSYETYPSYFAVKAVPQYEISQGNTTETQTIRYTLTPQSKALPNGLLLDPFSGLILGRAPYVVVSKSYEFTVEARVVFVNNDTGEVRLSAIASERTFSITIKSIFSTDSVTSLQINVPGPTRQKIAQWVWGNRSELREAHKPQDTVEVTAAQTSNEFQVFSRNQVYRASDPLFGRKTEYRILLASGLNYTTGDFLDRLKDYHHPTTLRIGQVQSAAARSPEGVYLYDVIYLGIIDPLQGAGGFNSLGQEEALPRYASGQHQTAIPKWNLAKEDTNYYPNSVKNLRLDLLNKTGRLAGHLGYGVSGKEGLPLWMMSEQEAGKPNSVLGYQCAIELAYVKAGSGPAIVKSLATAGMNADLQGSSITVDRYLLLSDGIASTTFDGPVNELTPTDDVTTFDGPDSILNPTTSYTTFDTSLQSESKYYKFPPGDR